MKMRVRSIFKNENLPSAPKSPEWDLFLGAPDPFSKMKMPCGLFSKMKLSPGSRQSLKKT